MRAWMMLVLIACGGTVKTPEPVARPSAVRFVPQLGHAHGVQSMAFSKDGRLLVTAADQGRIWDVATGTIVRLLPAKRLLDTAHFGPGVRDVTLVDEDGHVVVHDITTGAVTRTLELAGGDEVAATSRDGMRAAGSTREGARVWSLHDGSATQLAGPGTYRSFAFSGDGRWIAATAEAGAIHVWSAETGGLLERFVAGGPITAAALTTHGDYAIAGDADVELEGTAPSSVYVWEIASRKRWQLPHHGAIRTAVVAHDDRLYVADAAHVHVWAIPSMRPLRTYPVIADRLALAADGIHVATEHAGDVAILRSDTGASAPFTAARLAAIPSLAFSPDGSRLAVAAGNHAVVWDLRSLRVERTLGGTRTIRSVRFRAVDLIAHVVELVDDFEVASIARFDVDNDRDLGSIRIPPSDPYPRVTLSPDGTEAFYFYGVDFRSQQMAKLARRDSVSGGLLGEVALGNTLGVVGVTSDRSEVLTTQRDGLAVWNLESKSITQRFSSGWTQGAAAALSPDGFRALVARTDSVELWDADRGMLLTSLAQSGSTAFAFAGTDHAIVGTRDGMVAAWNLSGARVWEHAGHSTDVKEIAISPDRRLAASAGGDGVVRLWRVDTGVSISLVWSNGHWLVFSDDGYFDASKGGGGLVTAVEGDRVFRIDQLAARNNRPDILLERMGIGDPDTIAHFRARHERRLAKAQHQAKTLASAFRDAPRATIVDVEVTGKHARVAFELAAPGGLRSYNVWVNRVPVFGDGKPVSGNSARITERIELTTGANRIEVGATADNLAESLRAFRTVDYGGSAHGDLYYLGFGVSKYRDSRYDLAFAHKDAIDLASVFGKATGYRAIHTHTFTNDQVTVDGIRNAKQLLAGAKVDDTVIVFVAGHGVHAKDKTAEYYFATHEMQLDRLATTAAPFELVEGLLQGIAPRRKVFLMDTCESGEREPGEEARTIAAAGTRGLRARALAVVQRPQAAASTAWRAHLLDRDRYIYNEVIGRTGAIVLSSSRGNELSYELQALQNGAFTEELLRALTGVDPAADVDNDKRLSVHELGKFVGAAVPARTADLQHPSIDRDNRDVVIQLPIVPAAREVVDR